MTTAATKWGPTLIRESGDWVEQKLIDSTGIKWKIGVKSVYDEDEGIESIRIKHTYTGPLQAAEEIRFELVFFSKSDPFTDKKTLEADTAVCKMKQKTADKKLWTQTAEDNYYKCDLETCGAAAANVLIPKPSKIQIDSKTPSDWTIPIEDTDTDKPFCTPYTAAEISANPDLVNIACKEIYCIYQRPMLTDDIHDFEFNVSAVDGVTDEILLPKLRSNIAIQFNNAKPYVVYGLWDKDAKIVVKALAYSNLKALSIFSLASAIAVHLAF